MPFERLFEQRWAFRIPVYYDEGLQSRGFYARLVPQAQPTLGDTMLLTSSQIAALPQEDRVFAVVGHLSPEQQEAVLEEITYRCVALYGEDYWLNELDPEDRPYVDESDVSLVSEQDRDDLEAVYAWEAFGGFHNP